MNKMCVQQNNLDPRLGSGPLHPGELYLGWRQSPTSSTAFGDRMDSSPSPGVEPVSMTIGLQDLYQASYLIPLRVHHRNRFDRFCFSVMVNRNNAAVVSWESERHKTVTLRGV
ncbi:hypothetical protein YC2023_110988 [Brassica napus]